MTSSDDMLYCYLLDIVSHLQPLSHRCQLSFKPMTDGQKRARKWLTYSKSQDALFCIDCMLFSGSKTASDKWTRQGYSDWRHVTRDIVLHESSPEHHSCEVGQIMYNNKSRIDDRLRQITHTSASRNRCVVYVAIKCLKYLCSEMTAVRGHESYDGKFLHLFREFAEFDASSAAYLEMLTQEVHNRLQCSISCTM